MGNDLWSRHGGAIIFCVLLLAFGSVSSLPRLASMRPRATDTPGVVATGHDLLVERRLADDPLGEAVERCAAAPACRDLNAKLSELALGEDDRILVLVTATQPYAEQAERRLRDRVALQRAMADEGFVPADSEHLVVCRGKTLTRSSFLATVEVFRSPGSQAFSAQAGRRVAVVWVGNDVEGSVELWAKLEALVAMTCDRCVACKITGEKPCGWWRCARGAQQPDFLRAPMTIIGPPYSGDLAKLVAAAMQKDKPRGPLWPQLFNGDFRNAPDRSPRMRFVAVGPTATGKTLLKEAAAQLGGMALINQKAMCSVLRCVHRPTATDDRLLGVLAAEILLRQSPLQSGPYTVLLLVEQDTPYGRAMAGLMQSAISRAEGHSPKDCGSRVARGRVVEIPYLRGIDGEIAEQAPPGQVQRGQPGAELAGAVDRIRLRGGIGDESTTGLRRADYIRRVASQARRILLEDAEANTVVAIGLLGTDFYDKLMLAQALRPEFQSAVFFTTEADSRMISKAAATTMRNMVVASPFPLEAERDAQSGQVQRLTQPFRDSAQHGLYLAIRSEIRKATERADAGMAEQQVSTQAKGAAREPIPAVHLFEVGRTRLVELDAPTLAAHPADDAGMKAGAAVRAASGRPWMRPQNVALLSIAAFLGLCVLAYARVSGTDTSAGEAHVQRGPARWDPSSPSWEWLWCRLFGWGFSGRTGERSSRFDPRWLAVTIYVVLLLSGAITLMASGKWTMLMVPLFMWVVVIIAALFCLPAWRSHPIGARVRQDGQGLPAVIRTFLLHIGVVLLLALLTVAPLLLATISRSDEPWEFLEAVSVFPTSMVRMALAFLAVAALWYYWARLRASHAEIADRYGLPDPKPGTSGPWSLLTWRRQRESDNLPEMWHEYRVRTRWTAIFFRVSLLALLWLVGLSLVFATDPPVTPARGTCAFVLDLLATVLFVGTTLALNLVIWDQIRACNRFIDLIPNSKSWYLRRIVKREGHHPELAPSILDLRLIRDVSELPRTMVYVPVLLLVLGILARSPLVDNWVTTMPLVVALSLSVGVAMHGAFLIRSTARETREGEVRRLEAIPVGAAGSSGPTRAERDEVVGLLRSFDEGLFGSLWSDPVVKAVLIPVVPIAIAIGAQYIGAAAGYG